MTTHTEAPPPPDAAGAKGPPPPPPGGFLFSHLARIVRERTGVKPFDFAKRLGVTPSAVSQYEDPTTGITEWVLRRYAAAAGVDFEEAMLEAMIAFRLEKAAPPAPVATTEAVSS